MKVPDRDLWSVKEHTSQAGVKWWTFNYACMSKTEPPVDAHALVMLLADEGIDATIEYDSQLHGSLSSYVTLYRWHVHVWNVDVRFTDYAQQPRKATITKREVGSAK